MLSRERVFSAMEHTEADRVPLYIWIFGNPIKDPIAEKYGSINNFFDYYNIDMVQSFPGAGILADPLTSETEMVTDSGEPDAAFVGRASEDNCYGGVLTIDQALDTALRDPSDSDIYEPIRADVEYHKGKKGRAIWVQTPGVFESSTGFLGLQGALPNQVLTFFVAEGVCGLRALQDERSASFRGVHAAALHGTGRVRLASGHHQEEQGVEVLQ